MLDANRLLGVSDSKTTLVRGPTTAFYSALYFINDEEDEKEEDEDDEEDEEDEEDTLLEALL